MGIEIDGEFAIDMNDEIGTGRHEYRVEALCLAFGQPLRNLGAAIGNRATDQV